MTSINIELQLDAVKLALEDVRSMTCKPHHAAKNGSLHALSYRGEEPKLFEWINGMWNTLKTGSGTTPSVMWALGWRYVGPAETLGDLMKMESEYRGAS